MTITGSEAQQLMADSIDFTPFQDTTQHCQFPLRSTIQGPVLQNQGITPAEGLIPVEGQSTLQSQTLQHFYNSTLCNIDQLRFPASLPAASNVQAPPPQETSRTYYRGSPEEMRLKSALEKAKQSKNQAAIKAARSELEEYWKKIIVEEYGSATKEELPERVEDVRNLYHTDPRDPFTVHKLQVLQKRAQALGDQESLKKLEKIINHGDLGASSSTGERLATIAKKHAKGDGHHCLRYVADDLERIGINVEGLAAYQAANQLAGNKKVREIVGLKNEDLKSLPAGAIVVWDKCKGHRYGHISISLGKGKEASDVLRPQLTNYGPRFRVFVPSDM